MRVDRHREIAIQIKKWSKCDKDIYEGLGDKDA